MDTAVPFPRGPATGQKSLTLVPCGQRQEASGGPPSPSEPVNTEGYILQSWASTAPSCRAGGDKHERGKLSSLPRFT